MNCRILQGTVFDRLPEIEPGSIDCAVTSPPYWRLRRYLPADHPSKALELGQEDTPREYVANAVRWCGLVRECLADHGTLWVNVGDSYASNPGNGRGSKPERATLHNGGGNPHRSGSDKAQAGIEAGNLCLIPQRLAIAFQDDGWLVRSVVVWHKPACMPSSVTGWLWKRCRKKVRGQAAVVARKSHDRGVRNPNESLLPGAAAEWEDCPGCKKCEKAGGYVLRRGSWRPTSSWEPVLMLAKTADYYADGEAVKTPPAPATVGRDRYTRVLDDADEQFAVAHDHETVCDGANLRDVWSIPFEPLKEAHYAAFPSELAYRCLKAGTSQEGYCAACGAPFVRVVEKEPAPPAGGEYEGKNGTTNTQEPGRRVLASLKARRDAGGYHANPFPPTKTVGWRPSCRCPDAKPRPGRVLDPFCGSGRTGVVARRLGLDFVGVELFEEFAAMARRLLARDNPLFTDFGD